MSKVKSMFQGFASFAFMAVFENERSEPRQIDLAWIKSTPEGLEIARAHTTTNGSLIDEVMGATRLTITVGRRVRDAELTLPAMRFELLIGRPKSLPIMLDASEDSLAMDRVLFRNVILESRTVLEEPTVRRVEIVVNGRKITVVDGSIIDFGKILSLAGIDVDIDPAGVSVSWLIKGGVSRRILPGEHVVVAPNLILHATSTGKGDGA